VWAERRSAQRRAPLRHAAVSMTGAIPVNCGDRCRHETPAD